MPSRLLKTALILAGALACTSQPRGDQASETRHETGDPTVATGAWAWFEETDAEYVKFLDTDASKLLPSPNAFETRTQFWLDAIDNDLRARHPELRAVPKPRARVLEDGANAFVHGNNVCLDVDVVTAGAGDPYDWEGAAMSYFPALFVGKPFTVNSPVLETCVRRTPDKESLLALALWIERQTPTCAVTVTDDGAKLSLGLSEGCFTFTSEGPTPAFKFKTLALPSTSNVITVNTGLWSLFGEEEIGAVIAHELGHYYRSHIVVGAMPSYNFFYRVPVKPAAGRPTPDPTLAALGARVRKAEVARPMFAEPSGTTTRFSLSIGDKLADSVLPELARREACPAGSTSCPCRDLESWLIADAERRALLFFKVFGPRTDALTPEALAAYVQFETQLVSCAATITNVPPSDLADQLGLSGLSYWVFNDLSLITLPDAATPTLATLDDFTAQLRAMYADVDVAAAEAISERLGYYTFEQEADELSSEWMQGLGFDPRLKGEVAMKFLEATKPEWMSPGALAFPECQAARDRGWTDEQGQPLFVPIASFLDPHHSSCYRAFNVDREIEAHAYAGPYVPRVTVPASPTHEELAGMVKLPD